MKIALTVILLQIAGVAAIIAEFIIPSLGVISAAAGLLFFLSIYLVFTQGSPQVGFGLMIADLFIIPTAIFLGVKLLEKSPVTLKSQLRKDEGASSQMRDLDHFMGMEGKAITDLRPSGMAIFGGERIDVVSRGEYIEKDTPIEVVSVTANTVLVRTKA